MEDGLRRRYEALVASLEGFAVAFSGGVDSTFLLRALGDATPRPLALTARVPFMPDEEEAACNALARALGAELAVIAVDPMTHPEVAANARTRCYHCRMAILRALQPVAAARGLRLADGANRDDLGEYRPGMRAADEMGVAHPLLDGGWTKADIRAASRALGLPTADKPSMACLASRIPTDTPIDVALLRRIGTAEERLRAMGYPQVRVRAHGDIARLELPAGVIARAASEAEPLARVLAGAGFRYATLDLQGYRTGSNDAPGSA